MRTTCGLACGLNDVGTAQSAQLLLVTHAGVLLCSFPETVTAISFEMQGVYDHAQECYETAMKKARDLHNVGPAPPSVIPEYKLWEEHWCR